MSKEDQKFILRNVILSYPHFDKAQEPQNPGDKPKFSGAFVMDEQSQIETVEKAAMSAAVEKWGATKGPQMVTKGGKGSTIRTDVARNYAGVPGAIAYISARSEGKPGLVYRTADPKTGKAAKVEDKDIREVFYPGARVNVELVAFSYDKATNKGVGFALNNVQKWADSDRLDGRAAAEDTFEAEMAEAPATLKGLV
jgi:hypothetical protein